MPPVVMIDVGVHRRAANGRGHRGRVVAQDLAAGNGVSGGGRAPRRSRAPLVSVASERVSLMVRTNARTDAGASARWEVGASTGGL